MTNTSATLLTLLCLPLLALASGCAAPEHVVIRSNPPGASVRINGKSLGTTPVEWKTEFDRAPVAVVQASKSGYFSEEIALERASSAMDNGIVNLVLLEDESFKATTTHNATNTWLMVQCDPGIPADEVWQKIVDAVTTRFVHLEQLEPSSGYMRTVHQVHTFQGPNGTYYVRTRLIGNLAARTPLTYKFRIESENSTDRTHWELYDRIFKEDALLMEELQQRLGVK